MGYVDSNLLPGETVVYRGHLHWMRYFWAGFWGLLGLLSLPAAFSNRSPNGIGIFFLVTAAVVGFFAFLDVRTSEIAVTNKRVFLKQGIIRRKAVELLLNKIESINVNQGIFGRILGFGTIVPGGSGGTKQGFHKIAEPLELRKHVTAQIEAAGRAGQQAAG